MFFRSLRDSQSIFARLAPMSAVFLGHESFKSHAEGGVDPKKRDIFLVSNSLLYSLDDETIRSSRKLPPYVVVAPFWLDKAYPDFDDNDWRQSIVGFPSAFRSVFSNIHPHFPKDKFLSWKQIKETRDAQMKRLHSLHEKGAIVLFDYRKKNITHYETGKLFKMRRRKDDVQLLIEDSNTPAFSIPIVQIENVFNYLSIPRQLPAAVTETGFKTKPHTELYYQQIDKTPSRILVHGSGLSVV